MEREKVMAAVNTSMIRTIALRDTGDPLGERAPGRADLTQTESGVDLLLVRRCAQRDAAALRELVCRHQTRLYGFLARILESREDTEEAVQDVFLRVWQQADRFEGRAGFSTWLYRIAVNVAYDLLRRRKAQRRSAPLTMEHLPVMAEDAQKQALAGLEREERAQTLQKALGTLRPEDRLLLHLYYAEEMDYEGIGQVTGYSYPVLKVRLLRARQRLRKAVESLEAEVAL